MFSTHNNSSDNMHIENVLTSWALTIGSLVISMKGAYLLISSVLMAFVVSSVDYQSVMYATDIVVKIMQMFLLVGSGTVTFMTYKKLKLEKEKDDKTKEK